MTYVVTSNCIQCKYTDCVTVCPVDCFYELPEQLVIDPDECIDCGACVPECPVEAIFDEQDVPESQMAAIEFNAEESRKLLDDGADPITEQKEPLPTAEAKKEQLGF